jgi:tripartite-type tricarboxylate transporter receptor subunit TctC
MRKCLTLALYILALTGTATVASAQGAAKSVADFYRGNSLYIVIGSAPGGGFDFYARTIGRFMGKHLPGNPTIIPQNVPGSGGIAAGSRVAVTAPQDGTYIGAIHPTTIVDPVLGDQSKGTKPLNFTYLGSASTNVEGCFMRTDAPAKSFDDLFKTEVVFGAANQSSSSREYASLLQKVLGMKINIVSGYKGSNDIMLALERGEVQATCGAGYLNVFATYPQWFEKDIVRLVAYQGAKVMPDRKEMRGAKPAILSAKTEEQRQILTLYDAQEDFGRPYVTGADVPADRVEALRKAFMDSLNDPEFLKEMDSRGLDVSPLSGEDLQKLVASIYNTPPEILKKTRQALGYD